MFPPEVSEEGRRVLYCLIPRDLAPKLHELLRRHFADLEPGVEVVVERRRGERRVEDERRAEPGQGPDTAERRRIRNVAGRRVGGRRAGQGPVPGAVPALPRRARRHAARISFVERLEPSGERLEDLDTARLVTRFQAGDAASCDDAFSTLYSRYFDRVYGYLRAALRDPDEAEALSQEVFMKVYQALPRYERRRQPFRAWIFTMARNEAISHLRKHGRVDVTEIEEINRRREASPAQDPLPLQWIADRDLMLFVDRLPAVQRQVLALRYMIGLSIDETAVVVGLTPTNVSVIQSRALRFLRERLTAIGRGAGSRGRPAGIVRGVRKARVLRRRRYALLP